MTRNRKLLISAVLLAILGLLIWLAVRRFSAAPEAARLLPEGDVLVYANLKPVHLFELREPRPAQVEGEYKQFIDQTGIQFERDLDEVAMSRRDTPDGKDTESSEIFAGRFDQQRLAAWLRSISTSCWASVSARIRPTGSGPPSKPRWTWLSISPGMIVASG